MRVLIGGVQVGGCRSAEITSRGGSRAGSFHLLLAVNAVTQALSAGWLDCVSLGLSVDFGMLPVAASDESFSWTRMMTGAVDRANFDPVTGLVSLQGRDNAAQLIDMGLQDGYLNNTSSEVAQALASRCGLDADIQPTATLVGQYYQIEHAKSALVSSSRHGNGWDLLTELADIEGYEVWVDATTLHFVSPDQQPPVVHDIVFRSGGPRTASPSLTISQLTMDRSFGLAGPIQVKVMSWNSRQRRQVTAQYPQVTDVAVRQYQVVKPNLSSDEADALSRNIYNQILTHERVINGTMAGELVVAPRDQLNLIGTGTGWDRIYVVDRIEREMSVEHGFVQHITARSLIGGDSSIG